MAPTKVVKRQQLVAKATPIRKIIGRTSRIRQNTDTPESNNTEFQTEVRECLNKLLQQSSSMQSTIGNLQNTVTEIHTNQQKVEKKCENLETRIVTLESSIVKQNVKRYDSELEKLQIDSRKLNLIIVGLRDDRNETNQNLLDLLYNFIRDALELQNIAIDIAYRLGTSRDGNLPRNIKIIFTKQSDRLLVLKSKDKLRDKNIPVYINEDLPPHTLERRHLLRIECNKAHKMGKVTRLLGDRLIIDNITYFLNDDKKLEVLNPNNSKNWNNSREHASSSGTSSSASAYSRSHHGFRSQSGSGLVPQTTTGFSVVQTMIVPETPIPGSSQGLPNHAEPNNMETQN